MMGESSSAVNAPADVASATASVASAPAGVVPLPLPRESVVHRAVGGIAATWRDFIRRDDLGAIDPDLPPREEPRVRSAMAASLSGRGGEAGTRSSIAGLGSAYLALNASGKARFLGLLADFDVDREGLERAMDAARDADDAAFGAALAGLRNATRPPWLTILQRLNALPEGTKFLVDVRADLLGLAQPSLAVRRMERDLGELLASWFDLGFLELRRITWDASAALLERIARYEAVHEVRSWLDLKDRLDTDRRCYAYLHPAMPNEPLIFVEVALVREMSDRIAPLLDPNAPRGEPREATTALFYSISNCQRGLAGVSLGNALIKRVVEHLAGEFPQLKTFATLSPIPGFRAWLAAHGADNAQLEGARAAAAARRWHRDPVLAEAARKPLLRACARYLLEEKAPDGGALDAVARFHLSNGARMERLDWLADTSQRALHESAGMMINYVYRRGEIDANHEAYAGAGRIAASKALRDLARS